MDSHGRPPGFRGNHPTQVGSVGDRGRVDLAQAYTFARNVARMQAEAGEARGVKSLPGHRLVWVRGASFACAELVAADDAFAVIGRHTQCNTVLAEDPSVALRHVLVRSIALPAGGIALRAFDLHSGRGFTLPDGSRHTSIFAEGPVSFAVGDYAIVALPTESSGDELPGEMPPPVMDTPPAVRDQLNALALAMSPYRQNARPLNRSSRITLMPALVMVGEAMPPRLGRLATGGEYEVTLARSGQTASVKLADIDLACGVIIGRSEKCHSEALRRITDENTSRVHLLLLREGATVSAYDLASTQGTYAGGALVRRVVLPDAGAMLTLGRGDRAVELHWHPRA